MKRFVVAAGPFYAMAALALLAHYAIYGASLVDIEAIAEAMAKSRFLPAFVFACVFIEAVFPYFLYFPGTALVLLAVAVSPIEELGWRIYLCAWLGIFSGALVSYFQARFFQPLLFYVASGRAIQRCEDLFTKYGRLGAALTFVHPNYAASYFTALGLMQRASLRDFVLLGLSGAAGVVALFWTTQAVLRSTGATSLQLWLAACLLGIGTAVGLHASYSNARGRG